jgi:hypothetical protein
LDPEHAVFDDGAETINVPVSRQQQAPLEFSMDASSFDYLDTLAGELPHNRHSEHMVLDRELNGAWIDAWNIEIDVEIVANAVGVEAERLSCLSYPLFPGGFVKLSGEKGTELRQRIKWGCFHGSLRGSLMLPTVNLVASE